MRGLRGFLVRAAYPIGRRMSPAPLVLALLIAACGSPGGGARTGASGSFRAAGVGGSVDPTVHPARLLPELVDETVSYGTESGGGVRVMTAGLRVVTSPKGAILAAEDQLPQTPQSTTALPERLGGGFLFVLGTSLWRAERWLGAAKPIFTAPAAVQAIVPGLDRVYVRAQNAVLAIDGRTGQVIDLGPWPGSPYVASYAAADGWRAAAVTDMRGAVATFDAGASWRALDLPIEPKQVVTSGDSLAIGGFENGKSEAWYELRVDGAVSRLAAPPREVKTRLTPSTVSPQIRIGGYPTPGGIVIPPPPPRSSAVAEPVHPKDAVAVPAAEDKEDLAAKTFGKRPLATAIEDGWPLTDGTAVIARDGALARVRLADGALIELVSDAFPLKPSRCHPVPLTRPTAQGAFGFVCGEPRGTTIVYAYDPIGGRVSELRRFDKPRVVTSSGNGALAVRGPCAEDAEPTPPARPDPAKLDNRADSKGTKEEDDASDRSKNKSKDGAPAPLASANVSSDEKEPARAAVSEVHPYCILGHDNTWREIHVRGEVGGERVVVLTDGRIVVISPPQSLGTAARITILDKGRATTMPVSFPRVSTDVGRALRLGLWLDGFEERRAGVVGGWIEAGGVMLGLEITLDGVATPGQFIRDAGLPYVSGRYGLGWTASRRGYETTNGGMTWASIDLPDPLIPLARVERRACGPIGCLAHGWLRVGWGESKRAAAPPPPPPHRATTALSPPQVQLACEPLAPAPPTTAAAKTTAPPSPTRPTVRGRFGGFSGPPVLGTFQGLSELAPFFGQPGQVLRDSERGVNVDVRELVERYPNVGPLAKIYGWGPKTGEWDTLGRWQVKWLSPFAGWPEVRGSLPIPPPQMILDMTRATSTYYGSSYPGYSGAGGFQLAPGDDPTHALLVGKRVGRAEGVVFELEADRAPIEVHRADGEPFGEIEGIVRASGRWFIATPPTQGATAPTTVIWQIDGSVARELARVPRAHADGAASTSSRTRLARRSDGRAIGLVADGQPGAERASSSRWVLPIELETGALGEPQHLGYADLAGRTLDACTDDVVGWVLDTSMPSASIRIKLPTGTGSISAVLARLRLTSARACIERLAGTYDGQSPERAAQLTRTGAPLHGHALRSGELLVTALSTQTRFPMRCSVAK